MNFIGLASESDPAQKSVRVSAEKPQIFKVAEAAARAQIFKVRENQERRVDDLCRTSLEHKAASKSPYAHNKMQIGEPQPTRYDRAAAEQQIAAAEHEQASSICPLRRTDLTTNEEEEEEKEEADRPAACDMNGPVIFLSYVARSRRVNSFVAAVCCAGRERWRERETEKEKQDPPTRKCLSF